MNREILRSYPRWPTRLSFLNAGTMMIIWQRLIFAVCLTGIFFVDFSGAAVYKYIDQRGRIHFTNVPVTSEYRYYQAETGESARQMASVGELIQRYALIHGLDADLVRAVVRVESNFIAEAVSPRGAIGLMQLHPQTIADLKVMNPYDPTANIAGGAAYLRRMLDRFDNNLDLALAAYNSGPATVERYAGVPPYRETREYIEKVKYYQQLYREGGS